VEIMSDPERLLDRGSAAEARLLASALDEPPPPDLLGRTLDLVAKAAPATVAAGAAAGGSAKAGGLLGAIGIGATLGLLVVSAFELASFRAEPHPPQPVHAPTFAPSPIAPPPAVPSITTAKAAATSSAAAPAPSAPRPLTLAAELALLDEARSALREGDRATARALLDRYARDIPRGQLGREAALLRDKIEAEAEIDAGPTDR
jgi:hypothetical protein